MRLDKYKKLFTQLKIDSSIKKIKFIDAKNLPKISGVYIIYDKSRTIYVGQGGGKKGIYDRFNPHHIKKASGKSNSKSTNDTTGWNEGRAKAWWDPDSWLIEYVEVKKHVIKTYLEGKLILDLNPYANTECYKDRHELL